jgi:hypothetical protein
VVDALELGLDLMQAGFLLGDGGGGGGGSEGEGEEEGAEKDRQDCDSTSTVHCIASFWARCRGARALAEVSFEERYSPNSSMRP